MKINYPSDWISFVAFCSHNVYVWVCYLCGRNYPDLESHIILTFTVTS